MPAPLTLSLGEILWDLFPGGKTLGGAVTNAAWHLGQLGADARILSAVGEDALGTEILDTLRAMKLDVSGIAVLPGVPTSTVDAVVGADGAATYTIHENVAWDFLPVGDLLLSLAAKADAVNFGSLSQRSPMGQATTQAFLDAVNPGAIRLFDINLRPPSINPEAIRLSLARADVLKTNHDELPVIARLHEWRTADPDAIMDALQKSYPNIRHIIVTRAADGAWWRTGGETYSCPAGKIAAIVDTVGAGDSVTAVCVMGLLLGWEPERILENAMEIAAFVCGNRGGTPALPEEFINRFR